MSLGHTAYRAPPVSRLGWHVATYVAVLVGLFIVVMTPYLTVLLHPSMDAPPVLSAPLLTLVAATGASGINPDSVNRHDAIFVASGAAIVPMLATAYVLAYVVRSSCLTLREMGSPSAVSAVGRR